MGLFLGTFLQERINKEGRPRRPVTHLLMITARTLLKCKSLLTRIRILGFRFRVWGQGNGKEGCWRFGYEELQGRGKILQEWNDYPNAHLEVQSSIPPPSLQETLFSTIGEGNSWRVVPILSGFFFSLNSFS